MSALYQQHIHLPRRSGAASVGVSWQPHYPLVLLWQYIKALELRLDHTELSCVTEAAVCTYAYWDSVSKYTQQAHTQTHCKDKKHKIAHKVLTSTNTHSFHSRQTSPWNGMDGLLFHSLVSHCVHVVCVRMRRVLVHFHMCVCVRRVGLLLYQKEKKRRESGEKVSSVFAGAEAVKRMLFNAER